MTTQQSLKQTPFTILEEKAGGKFVDFFGWSLPVQYTSISQEHQAVREKAGLFDISHMGQVFVWGPEAEKYLQHLVTNDVTKAELGKGVYAHLLNEKAGVIDDIYVFRIEEDRFLLIVNASRKEVDIDWMVKQSDGFEVTIMEAPQAAALALQGPASAEIMDKFSPDAAVMKKNHIMEVHFGDFSAHVSRTGYTGEDGFEIFGPAGHLLAIWSLLFKAGEPLGLVPCGLGARDTLRTEVAYPLYGHELGEDRTPLEAGLSWVVKFDKGDFIGKDALLKKKESGFKEKLFGFEVTGGGVVRPDAQIIYDGKAVGKAASGTFSPTLKKPIGLAYLPAEIPEQGASLLIKMGARELTGQTVKLPFYKKPK